MEVREEEQVEEEGREKVRHTREPACIAVLTVLPKLRGHLATPPPNSLLTTHGRGKPGRRRGGRRRSRWRRGGRMWGTPGCLPV